MTDFRLDRAKIKHYEKTPEGFLRFTAPVGGVGALEYTCMDGSKRREYVSADVLKAAADSLKIKPITTPGHPSTLVNTSNARNHTAGSTGNTVWIDNGFLWVTGTVFDGETIAAIESGKTRELSLGYEVKTTKRSDGDYDRTWQHFNHLSPVTAARFKGAEFKLDEDGSEAWVATDAFDAPGELSETAKRALYELTPTPKVSTQPNTEVSKPMSTYTATLDGVVLNFERLDESKHVREVELKLEQLREDNRNVDKLKKKAKDEIAQAKLDTEQAREDAEKAIAKADAAEKKLKAALKDKEDLVAKLDAAESATEKVRGDKAEVEKTIAEINAAKAEIEAKLDAAEKDKDQLKARLDSAIEDIDPDQLGKMIKERMDAWNTVLPALKSNNPDFVPNYAWNVPQIMAAYVKDCQPELAERIDGLDLEDPQAIAFLNGVQLTMQSQNISNPGPKRGNRFTVDSLLGDIREARSDARGYNDPDQARMEARKKRAERIRNNSKALLGDK